MYLNKSIYRQLSENPNMLNSSHIFKILIEYKANKQDKNVSLKYAWSLELKRKKRKKQGEITTIFKIGFWVLVSLFLSAWVSSL